MVHEDGCNLVPLPKEVASVLSLESRNWGFELVDRYALSRFCDGPDF
jgi:hypothetical protein